MRVLLAFTCWYVGRLVPAFALVQLVSALQGAVEVWEWVVKHRIFDEFSEFSGWI